MMSCCGFVTKLAFLAFFIVNGWNTFQNLDQNVATFKIDYRNFEHSLTTRTGMALPPQLEHAFVASHSETIVKLLAWSQLILSAASILVWGGFTSLVGIIYFIQQAIHLNIVGLSAQANFDELEKFALSVCLMLASFAIGCCAIETSRKQTERQGRKIHVVGDQRANQSSGKKQQ